MKKRIVLLTVILMTFTCSLANADIVSKKNDIPKFPDNVRLNNRYFGYFIADLYHKEIMKAVQDYYKTKEIGFAPSNEAPGQPIVYINFGNELSDKFSYMLKISLVSSKADGELLGMDTLYFAVEPSRQHKKNLPGDFPAIKLVKYEHKKLKILH